MKKVKNLIEVIKTGLAGSLKTKIIAGIAGVAIAGGVAGGSYYWYTKTHNNSLPTVSREQVEKDKEKQEEVKKTEEEKIYDDKVIKLNSIVDVIKDLDPEFKYDDSVSENNVDELIKKYSDKRQDLLAQKEKENQEEEKGSQSTGGGSSSSGSSSSGGSSSGGSGSSGGNSTPSPITTPEPKPEPTPPPAPTKPSGWRQDIASAIVGRTTTPNTNCTSGENMVMTSSQLSNLNSWAEQWKNGSISGEQFKANAKNDAQSKIEGFAPTYLTNIILVKQSYSGDDPSTMYPTGSGHHYLWCSAYYDGSSNTTTVYYISGTMTRPGQ